MAQRPLFATLTTPLVILVLATAATLYGDRIPGQWLPALAWLPYALGAVGLWLALQFAKRQLLLSVALTLLGYGLIQGLLQAPISDPLVRYSYDLLSLGLPLALLCNQLLSERGLGHPQALLLYCLVVLALLLAVAAYPLAGTVLVTWLDQHFALHAFDGLVVSLAALVFGALALLAGAVHFLRRKDTLGAGLLFVMLANLLPLYFLDWPFVSSLFASAALTIALVTGIKTSHDLAYRDALTGLNGRRKLFERLAGLSRHYSLAMLDIDHFKSFNDSYGHDVGDDVLAMVAAKIAQVGGGGEVFRYGGEEFTLIFPGRSRDSAVQYLEEVRELIANTPFIIRDKAKRKQGSAEQRGRGAKGRKQVQITVSIGVAEKQKGQGQPEVLIKAADQALYQAKKKGRNCVVAA
ncbi:GGDEF domain-containing protein [Gallaecimonas kandeliae]|uniref:GGDEF domain-containing protein n=1 Tax=Gallaecimonas kandeliae TaxID=3029055 RepID=UPI00264A48CD|nr:GGDEF domain-containing protein [Gallaecimonas kandeliae]WKE67097.1 GGDEF domain-containing protein [Gallaecimonas kandeliae]